MYSSRLCQTHVSDCPVWFKEVHFCTMLAEVGSKIKFMAWNTVLHRLCSQNRLLLENNKEAS